MILIIGGFAQGKLHYVEQHYAQREDSKTIKPNKKYMPLEESSVQRR